MHSPVTSAPDSAKHSSTSVWKLTDGIGEGGLGGGEVGGGLGGGEGGSTHELAGPLLTSVHLKLA